MKRLLSLLFIVIACNAYGQLTVDVAPATVTVKEKTGVTVRTLTIYKSFVTGIGIRNQMVYQPVADEFGEEAETLKLYFTDEVPHLTKMFDAALQKRKYDCSRLSISILPYADLISKLTDVYANSPEWNDYLKKNTNLRKTTTLFDGSEISEVDFDIKLASAIFEKSNFLADFNTIFAPYGYKVTSGGFPDEHQQIVSADKLMVIGRNGNLFIPVPNFFFNLTKIKN